MKPTMAIVACAVALVMSVALTSAQVPLGPVAGVAAPIIPPVMPPMLGAMPFPFLGMGMGLGFGMGMGMGLPFLGPFGGILAMRRLALLGLMGRKKRDVSSVAPVTNDIRCVIGTNNNTIECSIGVGKKIGCEMETRLTSLNPKLKLNLVDLAVIEHVEGQVSFLNLISTKANNKLAKFLQKANFPGGTFTYIDPTSLKPVLLGIYADRTLGVPGFIVKDQVCFNSLMSIVRSNPSRIRAKLLIE